MATPWNTDREIQDRMDWRTMTPGDWTRLHARQRAEEQEAEGRLLHDLTFLGPGALPTCRRCGRTVTQEMWLADDVCAGRRP